MDKSDIALLYAYGRWANRRVLKAVSALTPEQFTRDLGGAFASVRDTFVHILSAEWAWLTYWKAASHSPEFVADLTRRMKTLFDPNQYPGIDSVKAKWSEIEHEQTAFVTEVTNQSLQKQTPFRSMQVPLVRLMQHQVNHSSYHRGQIALMLRQLGAEPVPTDFHVFLEDTQQGTEPGT